MHLKTHIQDSNKSLNLFHFISTVFWNLFATWIQTSFEAFPIKCHTTLFNVLVKWNTSRTLSIKHVYRRFIWWFSLQLVLNSHEDQFYGSDSVLLLLLVVCHDPPGRCEIEKKDVLLLKSYKDISNKWY